MRIRERRAEAEEELVKLFCTAREKIHNPVIEGVGNFARLLSAPTRPSDWINDSPRLQRDLQWHRGGATSHPLRAAACTVSGAPSKLRTGHPVNCRNVRWAGTGGRRRGAWEVEKVFLLRPVSSVHRELRAAVDNPEKIKTHPGSPFLS